MPEYAELFRRNYGILSSIEQERIRNTKVLIIGDSGVGETIAVELARSGFENLSIAGCDSYVPQDTNRQPSCTIETAGRKKTDVIRETILSINPSITINVIDRLPDEEELEPLVKGSNIVIPAVDDLSYSVLVFRAAKKLDKPAILCMPSGSMGWVSVIDGGTPSIEDVFGIPKISYQGLRAVMHTRAYRCAQYNFITSGDWRVGWFWEYFLGNRQLALICPVLWLAASLAALETIKVASGRWNPVKAPRCWYINRGRAKTARFSLFIKYHREIGWKIFGNKGGHHLHRQVYWFWRKFFSHLRDRQDKNQ